MALNTSPVLKLFSNMKTLLITFLTLSSCLAMAQNEVPDGANLRAYNFNIRSSFDSRIGRLFLQPEINLSLLNQGRLQINASYGRQIARLESWDTKTYDPNTTLVSTGIDRKLSSYEFSAGYNFVNFYNPEAIIVTSNTSTMGNWRSTTTIFEPGSKKILFGARGGFGAFRGMLGSVTKPYFIADNQKVSIMGTALESNYQLRVVGHSITEYQFAGLQYIVCATPDRRSDKKWGGRVISYYLDYVNVSKLYAAPFYSALGEKFYAIPLPNRKWTGNALRIGTTGKGSGRAGISYKLEGGTMARLTDYDGGFYFTIEVGMHITPLLAVIANKEDY
jgi:hypothetical protein